MRLVAGEFFGVLGGLSLAGSAALFFFTFTSKVTVETGRNVYDSELFRYAPEAVVNIGLLHRQSMLFEGGCALAVLGFMLIGTQVILNLICRSHNDGLSDITRAQPNASDATSPKPEP